MITRRGLLRAPIGLTAFAVATIGSVRPSRADPMALLTIMNLAATAVSAFAKSGGGLAAMLDAQFSLLNIVVEQLKRVQIQISELNTKINQLPLEFERIVRNENARSLIAEISGAALRYRELLEASARDSGVFDNSEVRENLRRILEQASSKRATLSTTEQGGGPETAFVVPVACAVEVAVQRRLQYPPSVTIATFRSYETWLSRILGKGPGSIESYIAERIRDHDSLISQIAAKWWDKDTDFEGTKFGKEWHLPAGSFNILLSPTRVEGYPAKMNDYSAKLIQLFAFYGRAYTYSLFTSIPGRMNEEIGAYLLEYEEGFEHVAYVKKTGPGTLEFEGLLPFDGSWCFGEGNVPVLGSEEDIKKHARNSAAYRTFAAQRDAIQALVLSANVERARIAFAIRSKIAASEAREVVRQNLKMLGP